MTISIGNDHAGTACKLAILEHLNNKGFTITNQTKDATEKSIEASYFVNPFPNKNKSLTIKNYGTDSTESVDYPDFVHPVAKDINSGNVEFGILICGTANGVAITANKYSNVRAGVCWIAEIAELARQHNNANIICIPARYTSIPQAIKMVDLFIDTKFEGGRHLKRICKMSSFF